MENPPAEPRSYTPEALAPLLLLGAVFIALNSFGAKPTPSDQPRTSSSPAHIEALPTASVKPLRPGDALTRYGDEIVVCGQLFHTTAPVVLWMDPGGYDAYRTESRFAPFENSDWKKASEQRKELASPNRYGLRAGLLSAEEIERVRGGGWELSTLQEKVDQFVLHYDQAGFSRTCFKILHDLRCLSVHFMLDVDGTLYQTLDLKERAWHATSSNTRSIGIEIANVGAYAEGDNALLNRFYKKDAEGKVRLNIPDTSGVRTADFIGMPARESLISGEIQGKQLRQYDLTPQQYETLIKLTATLCRVFPKIVCDYPRDESGKLITHKLAEDQLKKYHGVLGHYHIQADKIDPGPALQWDKVIDGAKALK